MAATLQGGRRRPQPSAAPDAPGADRPIQISTFKVLRRSALAAAVAVAAVVAAVTFSVRPFSFDEWSPPPATAVERGQLAPAPIVLADTAGAHAHAVTARRRPPTARRSPSAERGRAVARPRTLAGRAPAPAPPAPRPAPEAPPPVAPGPLAGPAPDRPGTAEPEPQLPSAEPGPVRDATRVVDGLVGGAAAAAG